MKIQIVNQSTVAANADVMVWATAIGMQLHDDYAPAWERVAPVVEFLNEGNSTDPSAHQMILIDTAPDSPGALGWHQTDAQGKPIGYIPCKTILDAGDAISSVLSHECLEMAGDPYCSIWCQTADGEFRAYEMADAVQNDSYSKTVGDVSVKLSNFLLPPYFVDTETGAPTDFMGTLKNAIGPARSPGGYDIVVTAGGAATQEFSRQLSELSDATARRKSHWSSRTAKRVKRPAA
jgi:hypothetical protein